MPTARYANGMMLLTELKQGNTGSKLYIESLANVLAVHLLRNYAADKPVVPTYQGGLRERQVLPVLDYINEHLHQEITLADLAALLGMSQFHFSHQFKLALGTTPYQYLLQQKIKRAKQLLKQTNSHSHLSKQFRQLTGMTPRAYRLH